MAWLQANRREGHGSPVGLANSRMEEDRVHRETHLYEVKRRLHRTLVERLNVSQLEGMEGSLVAAEIRRAVTQLLAEDPFPLNYEERGRLTEELQFEILGLGPLEPLVRDD